MHTHIHEYIGHVSLWKDVQYGFGDSWVVGSDWLTENQQADIKTACEMIVAVRDLVGIVRVTTQDTIKINLTYRSVQWKNFKSSNSATGSTECNKVWWWQRMVSRRGTAIKLSAYWNAFYWPWATEENSKTFPVQKDKVHRFKTTTTWIEIL